MISGSTLKDLPDTGYQSFSKANIFQFAKKAGYKTFLLDAQSDGTALQNYITSADLDYIDSLYLPRVEYPLLPSSSIDSVVAEKLACLAVDDTPKFVYINKSGAHWPYSQNYPADWINTSLDNPLRSATAQSDYLKAVAWNVDNFWKMLLPKIEIRDDVLVLYTSDHGEDYKLKSYRMKHASLYKPGPIEGLVPLIVYDKSGFFPKNFQPEKDTYSHEYIFPTLTSAMGYPKDFIQANYGRSLLEKAGKEPRWFLTGDIFGRGKNYRLSVDDTQEGL
jgi:glucan phosphoethanolaminetransferase (alkaline phosphatase superfamily)